MIDRVSIVADEKRSDSLDEGERVQLVQRADVRLEELEVVHVGEGLAELGQVGEEVVEGHKVELPRKRKLAKDLASSEENFFVASRDAILTWTVVALTARCLFHGRSRNLSACSPYTLSKSPSS